MSAIQSIEVPVDFSAPSRAAVTRARELAKRSGASIHLVHSARFPMPAVSHEFAIPGPAWETVREAARKEVAQIAGDLRERGLEVSEEVSDRDSVDAIHNAVEEHDADLVVMGSHGHSGFQHFILGSVAERTIRTIECPVMAVREDEDQAAEPIRRIVIATDFSEPASVATDFGMELAQTMQARIDLVHAFTIPASYFTPYGLAPSEDLVAELRNSARAMLEERVDALAQKGVEVEARFARGAASVEIPAIAETVGADAIVMGTRGNTGLKHVFLGSVAERVLRRAHCSVVVVGAPPETDDADH